MEVQRRHQAEPPTRDALLTAWRAQERGQPEGWDFSALEGRMVEDPVPWDLDRTYREVLTGTRTALDLGTGGGEHLLRFDGHLPDDTFATEGWAPNVAVARRLLAPHSIEVVHWAHDRDREPPTPMPFPDARFEVVLSRHEAYDAREIYRVLRSGGHFVTQQVDGSELGEIHRALGLLPRYPEIDLARLAQEAAQAGFEVLDADEHVGFYRFADVAALIAYLQRVPWDAPDDFSVDEYADELLALHDDTIGAGRPLQATKIRFWLHLRKPEAPLLP